jgi:thymidylate synthase
MDEVLTKTLSYLLSNGRKVYPRGMGVHEITAFGFQLLQPRARLIYNSARKMSLMFAIGELLWYLRGSNECEIISYYNKRYPQFSDDGAILHGAYGKRIFGETNQWGRIIELLREDPDTRQAVITIHQPSDLMIQSKDIPCTCSLQFFIRDKKLELIVHMRSNDIIWGTCYDVFSFTMFQEIMANELGLELGSYTHFVGSMHLYDHHINLAKDILESPNDQKRLMPNMPEGSAWMMIEDVLKIEEEIRLQGSTKNNVFSSYWREIVKILKVHSAWRRENNNEITFLKKDIPDYYSILLPQPTLIEESSKG